MILSVISAALLVVATCAHEGDLHGTNSTKPCNSAHQTWSVVNPNEAWTNHTFHPQVWYHNLDEIHALWRDNYFDYVLDTRALSDGYMNSSDGGQILLEGWETKHLPGSYPLHMAPMFGKPIENVSMLVDFTSVACRDSRIFVHCYVGVAANMGAELLVSLGFTNVHAAGPEGEAGLWEWETRGYELVYNDTFDPARVPPCASGSCPGKTEVKASASGTTSSTAKCLYVPLNSLQLLSVVFSGAFLFASR